MIVIRHNFEPKRFQWLWAKYVTSINDACHCTNCLRGAYSTCFSAHNPRMQGQTLVMAEPQRRPWSAIYLCGVAKRGYPRSNYPHNCHAALVPASGQGDRWSFEDWWMEVEGARFLPIPCEDVLPATYRVREPRFTTCRIFRWAVVEGLRLMPPAKPSS
jgi:hypothetical protein